MITAQLIGGGTPPPVQIVVDVTPNGVPWTLTGTVGDFSWHVPGGSGIGDGGQLSIVDNRAPGHGEVVYTFAAGGVEQTSAPIVVPFEGDFVIQTLNGLVSLTMGFLSGSLNTRHSVRRELYQVPNRRRKVARHDVTGDTEGAFRVLATVEQAKEFQTLISNGEALVYRLGVQIMDLEPMATFSYGDLQSTAFQARGLRIWEFEYEVVDDPYMDERFNGFTWDRVDLALASSTWSAFDARFDSNSWNEFDTFDWSTI